MLDQVEEVYLRRVPFFLVPDLGVSAGGRADPEGFVELPPHSRSNLNVISEEILHLHRWTRGYPVIEPQRLAVAEGYDDALRALGGYFDEYAFFPYLESVGLDPKSELEPTFVKAADLLRGGLLDRIPQVYRSGQFTLEWRVKLTLTHVRASLLGAPSPARDSLLELFEGVSLRECAEVGGRISSEITQTLNAAPDQVAAHMRVSLFTHLGLHQDTATIRHLFRFT
ncbi:MAG: hypothetical protein HYY65_00850 [Candidatus Tectomicrobia bacterium]|uniref:Uncharacterized protein n=1 Tax=Tectimicrobiota bacterium TaxID=2528274 RepID=A0A932GM21_UNCTE|nr:hypothetical protein [Candidatus Tectomicrobia bacterium]